MASSRPKWEMVKFATILSVFSVPGFCYSIIWSSFAKEILPLLNLKSEILPVKTEDYPTMAERPHYSVLENYLLKLEGLNIIKKWSEALKDFVVKYKERLLNE